MQKVNIDQEVFAFRYIIKKHKLSMAHFNHSFDNYILKAS